MSETPTHHAAHTEPGQSAEPAGAAAGADVVHLLHGHDGGMDVLASLDVLAPDLKRWIVDFAYGEVCARPVLDLRRRQLLTIAVLGAMGGCEAQLRVHVGGALDVGVPPAEIVEAALHLVPYAGFPRALNAIAVVREVFDQRGLLPPAQQR